MHEFPNLILVGGKGGVGRTTIARGLSRTLGPAAEFVSLCGADALSSKQAFEEYIHLKLGKNLVTDLFVKNRIVQLLVEAAPGIPDLVLLGKIWHRSKQVPHLVVELPSMGFGLAMFQSVRNFQKLMGSGPIRKDTEAMLQSLSDPKQTLFIVATLPEETPLREGNEMVAKLREMFPTNPSKIVVNRLLPLAQATQANQDPTNGEAFVDAVRSRQQKNLKEFVPDAEVLFSLPEFAEQGESLAQAISDSMRGHHGSS